MHRVAWTPVLLLAGVVLLLGTTPARAEDPSQADVDDVLMSVVKEPDAREENGFVEEIELPPAAAEQAREGARDGLDRASEASAAGRARAAEARERGRDANRGHSGDAPGQGPPED